MQFRINGKLVEVPGVCLDFQLPMFENLPGSEQLQDALRRIRDYAQDLNVVLQNMGDTIITQAADAFGDDMWTQKLTLGNAVPAHLIAGLGQFAQANYLAHINRFKGKGEALPDSVVPGTAPSPTAVLMLESMAFDPVKHGVTQLRRWIEPNGLPYTAGNVWISVNAPARTIWHSISAPQVACYSYGGATSYIEYFELDAQRHVKDSTVTVTAFPATAYTAGNAWISIDAVARTIEHAIPNPHVACYSYGGAGSAIQYIEFDAQRHVIDDTVSVAAVGGVYTASNAWIYIDAVAKTIGHTYPSPVPANYGSYLAGGGSAVGNVYWDSYHHVVSFTPVAVGGAYTAETPWISLNGTQICHGTTAASSDVLGVANTLAALETISRDARNHIVGATSVWFSPGNAWISLDRTVPGTNISIFHGPFSSGPVSGSFDAGGASAIRILCYDACGHVLGFTAIAV